MKRCITLGGGAQQDYNESDKDGYMKYKYLAATAYLCITFGTLSASVMAEQLASLDTNRFHPHETSGLTDDVTQATSMTTDQSTLKLLDTVWILGFAISGLVLLRKVQGE